MQIYIHVRMHTFEMKKNTGDIKTYLSLHEIEEGFCPYSTKLPV